MAFSVRWRTNALKTGVRAARPRPVPQRFAVSEFVGAPSAIWRRFRTRARAPRAAAAAGPAGAAAPSHSAPRRRRRRAGRTHYGGNQSHHNSAPPRSVTPPPGARRRRRAPTRGAAGRQARSEAPRDLRPLRTRHAAPEAHPASRRLSEQRQQPPVARGRRGPPLAPLWRARQAGLAVGAGGSRRARGVGKQSRGIHKREVSVRPHDPPHAQALRLPARAPRRGRRRRLPRHARGGPVPLAGDPDADETVAPCARRTRSPSVRPRRAAACRAPSPPR